MDNRDFVYIGGIGYNLRNVDDQIKIAKLEKAGVEVPAWIIFRIERINDEWREQGGRDTTATTTVTSE